MDAEAQTLVRKHFRLLHLGLKTLPEKCIFNKFGSALYCAVPKQVPAEEYPDSWYQGVVSFDDNGTADIKRIEGNNSPTRSSNSVYESIFMDFDDPEVIKIHKYTYK